MKDNKCTYNTAVSCAGQNGGRRRGQSTMEFTFAIVLLVMITIGMIKVFVWTGRDLYERQQAHTNILLQEVNNDARDVIRQIRPDFYDSAQINAVTKLW